MKEFQSTVGGRHAYNTDFKNLQELALAMQELFRECGGNFVISGCAVTESDTNTVSVSDGYVYIDGKVRKVAAVNGISTNNLYIVAAQRNGDIIPYADGNTGVQCIDYYAEIVNNSSVNSSYIAYDSQHKAFPDLSLVFFNYYAVCKDAGDQSISNLTVRDSLTTLKQLFATQGIILNSASANVKMNGDNITINNDDFSLCFSNTGIVSVKYKGTRRFSFSQATGKGTVTFGSVRAEEKVVTPKLLLNGTDIENRLLPIGVVQMWAGQVNKIPEDYVLCNGAALNISDYPKLYDVLGNVFNNGSVPSGKFKIPDLRKRFIAGYDEQDQAYNIGKTGGEASHTLTTTEMPSHTHSFDDYYHITGDAYLTNASVIYGNKKNIGDRQYSGAYYGGEKSNIMLYKNHDTNYSGSGNAHENRPPFFVLAYIIKAK